MKIKTLLLVSCLLSFALFLEGNETKILPEQFHREWNTFISEYKIDTNQKATANILEEEFALIEEFGKTQYPRRRQAIKGMDRDPRWTPYGENKVTLADGTEMSASYINLDWTKEGKYHNFIASQAPYAHNIQRFWQLAWENGIDQIVMVTELQDEARGAQCPPYWPLKKGESLSLDDNMKVTLLEESWLLPEMKESIQMRKFQIRYQGVEKTVSHYWYHNWPDQTAPKQDLTLRTLIGAVKSDKASLQTKSPILVHCHGGVGRTGVFITAYHMTQRKELNAAPVSMLEFVAHLRWQRPKLVSKPDQYIYCCRLKEQLQ